MAQQPDTNSRAEAEFGEPELKLTISGDGPDPRLIALVRVLARRTARSLYEQQLRDYRASRS